MSQFGLPQRNATSDANAGVVNPPSVKRVARTAATKQLPESDISIGVEQLGSSLGAALEKRLETEATNINEQRAADAAIRQAHNHAINQIDANKKRLGWEKAVFGENIEYRAAQQRAATNAVNTAYLKQATTLDQHAGETPEEYASHLKAGLDKILEPYGDDQETKQMVAQSWLISSGKLATKHYESHYAYNQTQQRDKYSEQIDTTFDTFTVDKSLASTPEEVTAIKESAKLLFTGITKPQGMHDIAWRGVINNRLEYALRKGNIGAYKVAEDSGWISNLKPAEKVAMDRALSAYDTDFSQKVASVYESGELAALEAKKLSEASGIYQNLRKQLDTLENRSSGTDRAKLALTRGHTAAQRGINRAREEALRIAKNAAEKALEAEEKQSRINWMKQALRTEDPRTKAGILNEVDPKAHELEDALDITIVEDITRLKGLEEPLKQAEATKILLEDPNIARVIARRVKGQEVESPLVKRAIETFINGFKGLTTEDGQLNEKGIVALQSLSQFEQNEDNFKTTVGNENYDKFYMLRRGMAAGQTADMILKDFDKYTENKSKKDIYGAPEFFGDEGKTISKREHVSRLIKRFTDKTPYGESLSDYMEEYNRGLIISKNDRRSADSYLRVSALNAGINYRGHAIPGGRKLNSITSYNFQQLMDGVQKAVGDSPSLLHPYITQALGIKPEDEKGNLVNSIDQVPNVSIYTEEGEDGFFIDSPSATTPLLITYDIMENWGKTLEQRANFAKLVKKADKQFLDAWAEEQQMLKDINPMVFPN